jgi:hypothetical protein
MLAQAEAWQNAPFTGTGLTADKPNDGNAKGDSHGTGQA